MVGAIDIGSNAIRLLIGQITENGDVKYLRKDRAPVRLGADVFNEGLISPESLNRVLEAIKKFCQTLEEYDVKVVDAVATSAVRNAKNKDRFVRELEKNFGIQLNIIDGLKEAELIYQAVDQKLSLNDSSACIMDIGGGSVELIYSRKGQMFDKVSLPLGTVRTLSRVGSQSPQAIREHISLFRDRFCKFLKPYKCDSIIGTGGNLECLGVLRKQMFHKNTREHIRYQELVEITKKLESLSVQDRIQDMGLRQDRADVLLPASYVTQMFMDVTQKQKLLLPHVGLKEGLLLSLCSELLTCH